MTKTKTRNALSLGFLAVMATVLLPLCAGAKVIYVDDDAPPNGNGQSWPTAYRYLQDAVSTAADGDEIRVAQGIYRPDQSEHGNATPGSRSAEFSLRSGLRLLGGYRGCSPAGCATANQRDIPLYLTTLTGDLAGDDGPGLVNMEDNSYTVVAVPHFGTGVLIEGLMIRGGNATAVDHTEGGGIIAEVVDGLTIRQCTIASCKAIFGAGGHFGATVGSIEECRIEGNLATQAGGGLNVYNSTLLLKRVDLVENAAASRGGGIAIVGSYNTPVTIAGSLLQGNSAPDGGGVYGAYVRITASMLRANSASFRGGGVFILGADSEIDGSVIASNAVTFWGGGVYCPNGHGVRVTNTTLHSNAAGYGGGAIYAFQGHPTLFNSITSANVAPWGPEIGLEYLAHLDASYSAIEGAPGTIGVSTAAYFELGDGVVSGTPDYVDAAAGDLRLRHGSIGVDAGSNALMPLDYADLDGDGVTDEPLPYDAAGSFRVGRFIVDMGAYELPFGDMNCDQRIDFKDIDPFVAALGQSDDQGPCPPLNGDLNASGVVDFPDIDPFVSQLGLGG